MNENLTRNQKAFLVACVGMASMAVLAAMTYLVPACVDRILNSDGFFCDGDCADGCCCDSGC